MMALKKKRVVEVDAERFVQRFAEVFGRPPTAEEFEEWCAAWGGKVEKNKCVFIYVET
ncbi:MAG: hypothetical protein ACO2PN_16305 [Pyrobaculum sp.]|jgi:hypothetical protein